MAENMIDCVIKLKISANNNKNNSSSWGKAWKGQLIFYFSSPVESLQWKKNFLEDKLKSSWKTIFKELYSFQFLKMKRKKDGVKKYSALYVKVKWHLL